MKYFISFGGPTPNYRNIVNRICIQALKFNTFYTINGLTDINLKNDMLFYNKHEKFITNNSKGYGYWIWKSYIVKKQLESMKENDILVYADAGCILNINGKERLNEYFDIVNKSEYGILSFELDLLEKEWTKMDVFEYLNAYEYLNTKQLVGGIFIIRKCSHTINLVNKWYDTCCKYNLIDDSTSTLTNDDIFKDTRHDQSIWSLIRKKYGTHIIKDETYFIDWNDGNEKPILAVRMKH